VRTHRTPAGAYRGYGVGQANFAFEQAVDIAANRLRIPPA
jgi:carbon-monoxide dehydrogenase large subunit